MGNRASIVFVSNSSVVGSDNLAIAVYVHWNGGPESVYAVLDHITHRNVSDASKLALAYVRLHEREFESPAEMSPIMSSMADATDPGDNGVFVVRIRNKSLKVSRHLTARTGEKMMSEQFAVEADSARANPRYKEMREEFAQNDKLVAEREAAHRAERIAQFRKASV
jgi:hypothetical protein